MPTPRLRLIPLIAMLAVAVAVLDWRLAGAPDGRPVFPPDDFVEYATATVFARIK